MTTLLRRIVFAAPVAAAGLMLGLAMPSIGAGSARTFPQAERELAQAQQRVSYPLHLPAWLPAGSVLERVSWVDNPGGVNAVDVWYRHDNGRIHIWQTSAVGIEKNPAGRGTPLVIGGRTWMRESVPLGTVLRSRLPDGVTIQVTGRVSDSVLQRIAASID